MYACSCKTIRTASPDELNRPRTILRGSIDDGLRSNKMYRSGTRANSSVSVVCSGFWRDDFFLFSPSPPNNIPFPAFLYSFIFFFFFSQRDTLFFRSPRRLPFAIIRIALRLRDRGVSPKVDPSSNYRAQSPRRSVDSSETGGKKKKFSCARKKKLRFASWTPRENT